MTRRLPLLLFLALHAIACGTDQPASTKPPREPAAALQNTGESTAITSDTPKPTTQQNKPTQSAKSTPNEAKPLTHLPTNHPALSRHVATKDSIKVLFSEVITLDPSIRLDIRYATTNNFTQAKIYDCPRCFLRPAAAQALVRAHKVLQKKNLGLKMFDCYRPRPYQQRLWDKVPNPDYVTPPAKGSMHSRGAAVDLTIVDIHGKELDMGTPYDFFGEQAHTDYTKLPAQVQANRDLLRTTLEAVGFKGIRTEWWHFSYQTGEFQLSDYVWPCKEH